MRLILAAVFLLMVVSCNNGSAQADPGNNDPPAEQPQETPWQDKLTTHFDAQNAWNILEYQCDMGFRVPGTSTHLKCRKWLVDTLELYCDSVEIQEFSRQLPPDDEEITMWNIFARINADAERRILLAAHWDTRPTADYNPPGQQDQPILGANDGASGVAVLVELARIFHVYPPEIGVDILLTDGEDYGPGRNTMLMGSEYFADHMSYKQVESYNYGILLDMIGDKELDIHPEYNSESQAGRIYAVAVEVNKELGYNSFKAGGGYRIWDDHLAIIERGVRMYNFIDFNYEPWHTTEDTPYNCSKDSLESVGRTVENLVYLFPEIYGPDD